jgi:hypothetical protein
MREAPVGRQQMADRKANEDPLITHAENASTKKR